MDFIKIGKIVNTHGIKGEIRILSKFPYKDKVFIKGMNIYIDKKDNEVINTYRRHKNFDMITMDGYSNINDVLKYKGKFVYVNKDDIKLDNNYLDEDIIGLNTYVNSDYKGIVKDIERYDKTVLLVIVNDNCDYLVPYDLIDSIDVNDNKIFIKDIEGLFNNYSK